MFSAIGKISRLVGTAYRARRFMQEMQVNAGQGYVGAWIAVALQEPNRHINRLSVNQLPEGMKELTDILDWVSNALAEAEVDSCNEPVTILSLTTEKSHAIYNCGIYIEIDFENRNCMILTYDPALSALAKKTFLLEERPHILFRFPSLAADGSLTFTEKKTLLTDLRMPRDYFYPRLTMPLEQLYEEFDKSTAPILLLMGLPRMGKTTLARGVCVYRKKPATYVTNESLASAALLDSFYGRPEGGTLVIEDVDNLLVDRKDAIGGHVFLSDLLGRAQGLVDYPNHRIVIVTNRTNEGDLDAALIGHGRCFQVINFRGLTKKEAEDIAEKHGSVFEPESDRSHYTLQDALHGTRKSVMADKTIKGIGFTS